MVIKLKTTRIRYQCHLASGFPQAAWKARDPVLIQSLKWGCLSQNRIQSNACHKIRCHLSTAMAKMTVTNAPNCSILCISPSISEYNLHDNLDCRLSNLTRVTQFKTIQSAAHITSNSWMPRIISKSPR